MLKYASEVIQLLEAMSPDLPLHMALDKLYKATTVKPKPRSRLTPHVRNQTGTITHIFCSYHKLWEPVTVGFPLNKTSPLGYKAMCKEGYSSYCKARYYNGPTHIVPRSDDIGSEQPPFGPNCIVFE